MRTVDEPYPSSTSSLRGLDLVHQENGALDRWVDPVQPDEARRDLDFSEYQEPTLLSLIEAVSEVTDDEEEIIATVTHMLSSGRIRFRGHFQDAMNPAALSLPEPGRAS